MAAFYIRACNDFGRIHVGDVVLVDPDRLPVPGSIVLVSRDWRIMAAEDVSPELIVGAVVSVYIQERNPVLLDRFFCRDHILTTDAREQKAT